MNGRLVLFPFNVRRLIPELCVELGLLNCVLLLGA